MNDDSESSLLVELWLSRQSHSSDTGRDSGSNRTSNVLAWWGGLRAGAERGNLKRVRFLVRRRLSPPSSSGALQLLRIRWRMRSPAGRIRYLGGSCRCRQRACKRRKEDNGENRSSAQWIRVAVRYGKACTGKEADDRGGTR